MAKRPDPKPKPMKAARPAASPRLPTEADVLAFIQSSPAIVGKREIARHFGITGGGKIGLKALLRGMEENGLLARRSRKLIGRASLPPVTVLEVIGADKDGEAYAEPVEWDERQAGKPPHVVIEGAEKPPRKGDRVLAKIQASKDGRYKFRGRVIKTLSDRSNKVLGVYRVIPGLGARIVPVDKKARHELQVKKGEENGAVDGELVEAGILEDRGRGLPMARVRERLGDMNGQRNISLIAIHHHGIPNEFAERVLKEAGSLKPFARGHRTDLRQVPLLTIDPRDARDHDDAVWAEIDGATGGANVIVAIADVAAYVRPGTALDREARIRGNSVYFPDRVVPMLPERISNDLCSLREKEERPALACFMSFDKSGRKTRHRFARVIMRSAAKLAYEEAQAAIDGRPNHKTDPLLERVLKPLWAAYAILLKGRNAREPLELDLPERRLVLDAHGLIERVVTPERLDAHKLVEEFMIQANVAAAEELENRKTPLLFRVHDQPSEEKVRALAEFLRTVNLSLPLGQVMRPKHFNSLLKEAEGEDYQHVVNEMVLRTQAQAIYDPVNKGHFGLALRRYAHFTSPIRRYADLIVHRALITALGFGPDGLSADDIARLPETAEMISDAERRAMAAERETIDRLIAAHLADHTGATFRGRIGGVVSAGLFVKLDENGADGFVPVTTLGREYFVHDKARHALIGERSGETYQLGDRLEVRLVEATPVSGGMRFEVVSKGKEGQPANRRAIRPTARPFRGHKPKARKRWKHDPRT
ncbi:MAG: ribonuclease R [Aestuariivirga sp.]|uniref:ribonuclease R n=1 Tax=Aestuariivirga sp. TaxID=2650926 RepID=UPI0025B8C1EE|nr:ribonuclease R [Aestuariivirga sp.]MCA3560978.1 ribonuclease R [Aestuariivirga sp.]